MNINYNIVVTSLIISTLIIILLNYTLLEYLIEFKDQIISFVSIFIIVIGTLSVSSKYSKKESIIGGNETINNMFAELADTDNVYNQYMNNNTQNELTIDDIPNIADKIIEEETIIK